MRDIKVMPWVAILGADGAGKSSVIDLVVEHLCGQGVEVDYHHWCPKLNASEDDAVVNVDPHGQFPRGWLISNMKLIYYLVVWRASFLGKIRESRRKSCLVLFDRYYEDLLVDPIRYRFSGSRKLARFVFRWMPKPDCIFFLDAPAEVLCARKQEVEIGVLRGIVTKYQQFVENDPKGIIVDATQPIDCVAESVIVKLESLLGLQSREAE